MKYKGDRIGVCLEFGIRLNSYDATLHGSPTFMQIFQKRSTFATIKKWYGEWYINDYMTFLMGQDYTPTNFINSSNQVFWGTGFSNVGCLYTGRTPMFQLSVHDHENTFEGKVAAVKVDTTLLTVLNKSGLQYNYRGESKAPKAEGSFSYNLEKDFLSCRAKVAGGFQKYYSVLFSGEVPAKESKIEIISYVVGGDFGIKVGPVSLSYDIFYGQNIGPYGVYIGDEFSWWRQADFMRPFYPIQDVPLDNQGVPIDSLIEMKNGKATEMALILAAKPFDALTIEIGGGTILGTHEYKPYNKRWEQTYAWYAQIEYNIMDCVKISPEVGQYLYGEHFGFGRYLYWGLNTNIGF